MRILYIIDSLVPAGAEQSLAGLVPHIVTAGQEVMVLSLSSRAGLQSTLTRSGASVTQLKSAGRARELTEILAMLRDNKPQLVHTTLFEADVLGRTSAALQRTPVVSSLVNVMYGPEHRSEPNMHRTRLFAARVIDATTARFTRRLHAITEHVADVMAPRLIYPRDRIDVVPRGRDRKALGLPSTDRRARTRKRIGIGEDRFLILSVARQEAQKSLETILRALPLIPPMLQPIAVFVGRPGSRSEYLKSESERLGVSGLTRFLGPRNDVADLLVASDVMVLPSLREGFGGAVIEAMALNCPVVVSDLPVFKEVTGPTAALRFPVADHTALATALTQIQHDPEGAAFRAAEARDRFEQRFRMDRVAQQMMEFYERALGTRL